MPHLKSYRNARCTKELARVRFQLGGGEFYGRSTVGALRKLKVDKFNFNVLPVFSCFSKAALFSKYKKIQVWVCIVLISDHITLLFTKCLQGYTLLFNCCRIPNPDSDADNGDKEIDEEAVEQDPDDEEEVHPLPAASQVKEDPMV